MANHGQFQGQREQPTRPADQRRRDVEALARDLFERRVGTTLRFERTAEAIAADCWGLAEDFYRCRDARETEAPQGSD